MKLRTIMVAGAAVAAFLAFAAPSQADSHYKPMHKPPSGCVPWHPGCPPNKPPHHPPHHRPHLGYWYGFTPFFYGPGYYDYDDNYGRYTMSCGSAKARLARNGYRSIVTKDCVGRQYQFVASKNGHKYRIKFNAYTGGFTRYALN